MTPALSSPPPPLSPPPMELTRPEAKNASACSGDKTISPACNPYIPVSGTRSLGSFPIVPRAYCPSIGIKSGMKPPDPLPVINLIKDMTALDAKNSIICRSIASRKPSHAFLTDSMPSSPVTTSKKPSEIAPDALPAKLTVSFSILSYVFKKSASASRLFNSMALSIVGGRSVNTVQVVIASSSRSL